MFEFTRLWSKRFSPALGWHWQSERIITDMSKREAWMKVFQVLEPGVIFVISKNEPKG